MGAFDDVIKDMDNVLFGELAEVAIYNNDCKIKAIVDLNVEQFGGFDTTGPVRRHEVSFLVVEIPNPKRGQTIETCDGVYTLDGSVSNDGHVARWHINAN